MEPIQKKESDIHTVLILKNWSLEVWEKSDLDRKNYFYQVHSKIDWFALIDYDKTDTVPIVKDILNRQNTFIEIKYLRILMILSGFMMVWMIALWIIIPLQKVSFDPAKIEILNEIKKLQKNIDDLNISKQKIASGLIPYTPQVKNTDQWYSPIFPEQVDGNGTQNNTWYSPEFPKTNTGVEIRENTHKNIQNYAN